MTVIITIAHTILILIIFILLRGVSSCSGLGRLQQRAR